MTRGIDVDSSDISNVKAIFLRQEQRDAALDAVDAVEAVRKVVLTGSPGAGKTFGTMAAVVAELLKRGEPVLRTSKGPMRLHFFKVRDDGGIDAWSADWVDLVDKATKLVQDRRLTLVVDPTEEGTKTAGIAGLPCRVIHMPSDNQERHYRNWDKYAGSDAVILYTNPPTSAEAVIICRELWNEKSQSGGGVLTGVDLDNEIQRRALLVGQFPRYIVDRTSFETRIQDIVEKLSLVCAQYSETSVVKSAIHRELSEQSGRIHFTCVNDDLDGKGQGNTRWSKRLYKRSVFLPLTAYVLHANVPKIMGVLKSIQGGSSAGWFFERSVCEGALRSGGNFDVSIFAAETAANSTPNRTRLKQVGSSKLDLPLAAKLQLAEKDTQDSGYDALKNLSSDTKVVLRLPTCTFPFIDFATSHKEWFNAKYANGTLTLGSSPGITLLRRLGLANDNGKTDINSASAGSEDIRARLYVVSYDDNTSPIILKGEDSDRETLLKHVEFRRLALCRENSFDGICKAVESALKMTETEHFVPEHPRSSVAKSTDKSGDSQCDSHT